MESAGAPATALPVRRLTLYKHGVGFVEREGRLVGDELQLVLRSPAVNDVLKSLIVLDRRGGQVRSIEYQTPVDQASRLAESPLDLSANHALLDLLRDLRGTPVRLQLGEGTQLQEVEGRLLGVEVAEDAPARQALVSLWHDASGGVIVQRLADVRQIVLPDGRAVADVGHFLDISRSEDTRRTVTVRLSDGEHELRVAYLVPSPSWRVSYRLVAETGAGEAVPGRRGTLLLQGWGLFDNRLEEDLTDVQVTLVAGQPISFVYDLASSHIPARRVVRDEARVAAGPVEFERSLDILPQPEAAPAAKAMAAGALATFASAPAAPPAPRGARARLAEVAQQPVAATGTDLGELFQYQVMTPVTVGRGASALVPILATQLPYRRELLFNEQKLPSHPVAALRFTNESGLVLERGPVTLVEDGEYRGEALVPFTKPGNEVYLPYSVELGIRVSSTTATRIETAGLRIEQALLCLKQSRITETTYLLVSDLAATDLVTLEHPILSGHELVDTRPPDEQTAGAYRWTVACPPRVGTRFAVAQRLFEWEQRQVLDLSYEALDEWLARRWLDAPTLARIRSLLQERAVIATSKEEIGELQAERDRIYQREEALRKNLAALSTAGEEAALRRQVFAGLQASEDRLTAIDERIAALEGESRRRQAALDAALAALTADSTSTAERPEAEPGT
jgi:hypothetical protein